AQRKNVLLHRQQSREEFQGKFLYLLPSRDQCVLSEVQQSVEGSDQTRKRRANNTTAQVFRATAKTAWEWWCPSESRHLRQQTLPLWMHQRIALNDEHSVAVSQEVILLFYGNF